MKIRSLSMAFLFPLALAIGLPACQDADKTLIPVMPVQNTSTPSPAPSSTPSAIPTATPTTTDTSTSIPTATGTFTSTFTGTASSTSTPIFTGTATGTSTQTATPTQTGTITPTGTPTNSPTITGTPTVTLTPTPSFTTTLTYSPTWTRTPTQTSTSTQTYTPTATPPPMSIFCSSDIGTKTGSGRFSINYATAMVPLCDGWILYGDLTTNKVQAVNVLYNITGTSYQLSAVPGEMAYDATTGFLYVILTGASYLAKVDLNSGTVTNITLPAQGVHLAAAGGGYMFVSLTTTYNWPNEYISYVNGNTNTVVTSFSMGSFNANAFLASNSAGTTLYVGAAGCSNCTTYEFGFNTSTYALTTLFTASGTYTTNGQEMALSPDENHLAWVNGGGNGGSPVYTIFDISTSNINNTYGSWNTGAYPRAAGFSPDSANVATTNGADLQVFSVATHAASKTTWTAASAGSGGTPYNIYGLVKTRFSRGGKYVFGLDAPNYVTPAPSAIVWESFP